MAFTEDLSEFFDSDDFAVTATYNLASVNGIFDTEFVEVAGVEGEKPVFMCAEDDVSGVAHGDTITISATNYSVIGIQPDGQGAVVLILSE